MNFKIKDLDKAIETAQRTVKELQQQRKILLETPEEERLAIYIHEKQCRSNHVEMCSWFYETQENIHNWNGYAHKSYLIKAKEILKISDYETAIAIINKL